MQSERILRTRPEVLSSDPTLRADLRSPASLFILRSRLLRGAGRSIAVCLELVEAKIPPSKGGAAGIFNTFFVSRLMVRQFFLRL
jgi:hypothetical protein